METEKIDVPKFEGFECAGILIPKEHNDVYILNGMGDELELAKGIREPATNWAQLCYRKIKPKRITFESTGEVRPPKHGEYFKTAKSVFQIDLAEFDYSSDYEIYRVVEEQS
jgi:hypothetical protein